MRKILLKESEKENILNLYNQGNSRKAISRKLELSEHVVRKFIETSSLQIRPYKYIGTKFGKLLVLERVGTATNNAPIVKCQCDCGSIKNIIITNLTNGGTVSCGCYNMVKAISKNPWPTEFKTYINQENSNRRVEFFLTLDEFRALCSSNCFYCNSEPNGKMQTGIEKRNGIDRVDSSIGYLISNCVSCCWTCNRMKQKMPKDKFIEHIKKIYDFILSYECL